MIKGTKSEESNLEINLSGIETDDKMFGGKGQNQKKKRYDFNWRLRSILCED